MDRVKVAGISEKIVEYGFCALIFFLPISKALTESVAGLIILGFIIKEIAVYDRPENNTSSDILWLLGALFVFNAFSLINSGPLLLKSLKTLFSKWTEYFLLLIIAADHFRSAERVRRFFYFFLLSACLVGCSSLSQKFFGFEFLRNRGMPWAGVTGPFENPNSLSSYIVLGLPIVAAMGFWGWKPKAARIAVFLTSIILSIALLLTFSRSGLLGFFLAFLIMILLFRKRKFLLIMFFLSLTGLFAAPFKGELTKLFDNGTDTYRFAIWQSAFGMIREHPFLGMGLGTFMDHFYHYMPPGILSMDVYYAHNCYLQIWAEAGALTLAVFLVLVALVLGRGTRSAFINRGSDSGILLGGLTAGLGGFLAASFFDNQLYSVQLSVLFWTMLGIAVALEHNLAEKDLAS